MDIQGLLTVIADEIGAEIRRGEVASYIPGLAAMDLTRFGIAVCMADGRTFEAGNADIPFSLQSVSKVFALSIALGKVGDSLWHRVGREPSGTSFNSIVQLEHDRGIPRNPFVNAGAIVVDDVLLGASRPAEAIAEIVRFVRGIASDETIVVDKEIALGERDSGFRNTALANYMKSFDNLRRPVNEVLGVYYHQCALSMNCRQLARSGRYLMHGGTQPGGGTILTPLRARRINALMLLCGLYDGAGDFAFRIGLPGKSGVGGGLLAIVPGKASIGVWSPGLDPSGNSLLGIKALEKLAERTGWSVF